MPSRSPASYVYAVNTTIYSLTLSPLNVSKDIINNSIISPPWGGGRGGIEVTGSLLRKLNSSPMWKILIISRVTSSEKILL